MIFLVSRCLDSGNWYQQPVSNYSIPVNFFNLILTCYRRLLKFGEFLKLIKKTNFEDTQGVIRSRKSKDRQYNGQKTEGHTIQWLKDRRTYNTMVKRQKDIQNTMVKRKCTNNDLQNTTQKTKNWTRRTQLNPGGKLGWSGRENSSRYNSDTRRVILVLSIIWPAPLCVLVLLLCH